MKTEICSVLLRSGGRGWAYHRAVPCDDEGFLNGRKGFVNRCPYINHGRERDWQRNDSGVCGTPSASEEKAHLFRSIAGRYLKPYSNQSFSGTKRGAFYGRSRTSFRQGLNMPTMYSFSWMRSPSFPQVCRPSSLGFSRTRRLQAGWGQGKIST